MTQATSDDGDPTPGYLLEEIRNITFQSPSCCQQLVDYLIYRLNKSSSAVKFKVLKIIMYLINNGQVTFRQQLRQHDGSIKNAVCHSGPPDPLLGNTLYKDVQKLAQDTLDSMFNPEMIKEDEVDANILAPLDSPAVFMTGMGANARSSGKYEGFGNTPKDREGTVTDKMLDYIGRLIHSSDEQTSEVIRAALHSSPGDYQPVPVSGELIEPVFQSELPTPKAPPFSKTHVPGRAGGGWESDGDENDESLQTEKIPVTMSDLSSSCLDVDVSITLKHLEHAVDNGNLDETQELFTNFCECSGIPSVDELDEICAKCSIIGFSQVLKVLPTLGSEFIKTSNENGLMRVLLVWEWLYHHDNAMHQALSLHRTELFDQVISNLDLPSACKTKAKKLKILHDRNPQNTPH